MLRGRGNLRAGEKVRNRDERDGARRYSPSFHSQSSLGWIGALHGVLRRVAFEYPRGVRRLMKADSTREVVVKTASADVHRLRVPCSRTGKKRRSRRPGHDAE